MLKISNLYASINDNPIIKNLNLEIRPGEIHSIMGPNGSGKSTLFKVLTAHPECQVTGGKILYRRQSDLEFENLLEKDAATRAREGIFMAFQHPVEVPGVSNLNFLRAAFNSICRHIGIEDMNEEKFLEFATAKAKSLNIDPAILKRQLNEGFSGGEKKKNELLQMSILSPSFSLLDEIDSGLDIDSIKLVSKGIRNLKADSKSMLLITHYHRLLNEVRPDFVHVFVDGQIKKTGDHSLSKELDKTGYDQWM